MTYGFGVTPRSVVWEDSMGEDRVVPYGHVEVTDVDLLGALGLEEGHLLSAHWIPERGVLLLTISHKEFPPLRVHAGQTIIPFRLQYRTHQCGHTCELGSHTVVSREPVGGGGGG